MILLKNINTGEVSSISDKEFNSLKIKYRIVPACQGFKDPETRMFSSILRSLELIQRHEDVLMLGRTMNIKFFGFGLGSDHIYQNGVYHSNFELTDFIQNKDGDNHTLAFDYLSSEIPEVETALINGLEFSDYNGEKHTTARIACLYYPEGFVFKVADDRYFRKFTANGMITSHIGKAKVFLSMSDVLAYTRRNLLGKRDIPFSVVPVCDEYGADLEKLFQNNERAKEKHDGQMEKFKEIMEFQELLSKEARTQEILEFQEISEDQKDHNDELRNEAINRQEAIRRFEFLGLHGLKVLMRKDVIVVSLFNDCLCYTLDKDKDAEKAVEICRIRGLYPYHVIKMPSGIFPGSVIYEVLFVDDIGKDLITDKNGRTMLSSLYCRIEDDDFIEIFEHEIPVKTDSVGIRLA